MIFVLDNHDSFTFTLVDYLKQLGASVEVWRNDALSVDDVLEMRPGGILISPGPGRPEHAGISVELAQACIDQSIPYCGICLGHQALGLACGSPTVTVPPRHGKISNVRHDGSGLFEGLPSPMSATRYHSLAVRDVAPPLIANAWSDEGVIMAMRHESAPAHGVQFHPESIASEHGLAMLKGFVEMTALEST